jgi:hypothetical protein
MGPKAIGTGNVWPVVWVVLAACLAAPPLHAATQVSRHEITWTFDRDYETGQFVNGDWWVVGPVTIVSVSPDPRGAYPDEDVNYGSNQFGDAALQDDGRMRNGSMVVLQEDREQGYDSRVLYYDPALSISFPYDLTTNRSLISSTSLKTNKNNPNFVDGHFEDSWAVLESAAVLTCLAQAPPVDAFRPPYGGTDKPIYRTSQLRRDLLTQASLTPVSSTPDFARYERYFERVWPDHMLNWVQGRISPLENMPGYGREYARLTSIASLMLLLDVPEEQKETLLVRFVQLGIDLNGIRENGGSWPGAGGIWSGRKWPIVLASLLLDDPAMLPDVSSTSVLFAEDQQTYFGQAYNGATSLYQMIDHHGPVPPYEEKNPSTWTSTDNRSESYRTCCTSAAWVGTALAARHLRAMQAWNHDAFFTYCDRWMEEEGAAWYADGFVTDMWNAHRDQAPPQAMATQNLKWVWNSGSWTDNPNPHASAGQPIAHAGADQTVEDADDNDAESVTLDGSGSSDPDGTIVSYLWTDASGQIATGVSPTVSLSVGTHLITLTVLDNDGVSSSNDVVITVRPYAEPGTLTGDPVNWQSQGVDSQTDVFVIEYDVTPNATPIDWVVGLSDGPAFAFNDLGVITRFNPSGLLDVRNGGAYGNDNDVAYQSGQVYHFKVTVDISNHTYDAEVTWQNASGFAVTTILATNYAFRSQQSSVAVLDTINVSPGGPHQVRNISISSVTPPANNPPVLNSIGNQSVNENDLLTLQISASDADSDPLSYAASGLPANALFSPANRTLTWTPGFDDSGSYDVTFSVSDGIAQDSEQMTISVVNVNRPPVLAAISNVTGQVEQAVMFSVNATDPDGDIVTYSALNLPTGASLTDQNFTWTPGFDEAGSYQITIIASDGELEDTQQLSVVVADTPNRAPILTPLNDLSVDENNLLNLIVDAQDEDGDDLTYSAAGLPTGASFDTQTFTWTPGFDQAGIYPVTLTVSDGAAQDSQSISITVLNVNRPPLLELIGDPFGPALESLTFTVAATDPDGDALSYSMLNLPGGASFSNQRFAWTPALSDAGSYPLTVVASDGDLEDMQQITLTIGPVNLPPVLDTIGNRQVDENSTLLFSIQASDENNDTLIYNIANLPDGAIFENQVFTWTPTFDQAGDYTVTFTVSDGQLNSIETVTIAVENVNRPPVFNPLSDQTVNAASPLSFSVQATDPDGDDLTFAIDGLPAGATFTNQLFSWTPPIDSAGIYPLAITVSDGQESAIGAITITVSNINRSPVITAIPNQFIDLGETIYFPVEASDADGDSVTVSIENLPPGANFADSAFQWTPTVLQSGVIQVTLVASDGQSQSEQTVTLYVSDEPADGDPPEVLSISPPDQAVQVERNSLVIINIADNGEGLDAASVEIDINDTRIYQGDVAMFDSALGRCRRSGNANQSTYTFQPLLLFDNDQKVHIQAHARDLAGNTMPVSTAWYATEMHTFGQARRVNGSDNARCGRPVSVADARGDLWIAWHEGPVGQRNIHISRLPTGSGAFDPAVIISENESDQINPTLAVDAEGKVFVAWQEERRGNWDIYVSHAAGGADWSVSQRISDLESNQINPALAVDGTRVYLTWQDNLAGNEDIYVASSTNQFNTTSIEPVSLNTALQTDPAITVVNGQVIIVWTDLRHNAADLYGATSASGWTNVPLVTHAANQSQAALAGDDQLHLTWVDDRSGNNDIFYAALPATLATAPVEGASIIDDTTGRRQDHPSIILKGQGDQKNIYVAWQDQRNAVTDPDIYFTTVQSDLRTNVLVTAESQNAHQSEPALGLTLQGAPYLVWVDRRNNAQDIYYTGVTNIAGEQVAAQEVSASNGGLVGTPVENIDSADDVSAEVPVGAFPHDVTLTISAISNPVTGDTIADVLSAYDFGPSSDVEFARPITLTLPYEVSNPAAATEVFWYNPQTGELSQSGLSGMETIEISPTLRAMRFNTTHFSQFLVGSVESDAKTPRSGGAGGCSLSEPCDTPISIVEFLLPFTLLALAIVCLKQKTCHTHLQARNKPDCRA